MQLTGTPLKEQIKKKKGGNLPGTPKRRKGFFMPEEEINTEEQIEEKSIQNEYNEDGKEEEEEDENGNSNEIEEPYEPGKYVKTWLKKFEEMQKKNCRHLSRKRTIKGKSKISKKRNKKTNKRITNQCKQHFKFYRNIEKEKKKN